MAEKKFKYRVVQYTSGENAGYRVIRTGNWELLAHERHLRYTDSYEEARELLDSNPLNVLITFAARRKAGLGPTEEQLERILNTNDDMRDILSAAY